MTKNKNGNTNTAYRAKTALLVIMNINTEAIIYMSFDISKTMKCKINFIETASGTAHTTAI